MLAAAAIDLSPIQQGDVTLDAYVHCLRQLRVALVMQTPALRHHFKPINIPSRLFEAMAACLGPGRVRGFARLKADLADPALRETAVTATLSSLPTVMQRALPGDATGRARRRANVLLRCTLDYARSDGVGVDHLRLALTALLHMINPSAVTGEGASNSLMTKSGVESTRLLADALEDSTIRQPLVSLAVSCVGHDDLQVRVVALRILNTLCQLTWSGAIPDDNSSPTPREPADKSDCDAKASARLQDDSDPRELLGQRIRENALLLMDELTTQMNWLKVIDEISDVISTDWNNMHGPTEGSAECFSVPIIYRDAYQRVFSLGQPAPPPIIMHCLDLYLSLMTVVWRYAVNVPGVGFTRSSVPHGTLIDEDDDSSGGDSPVVFGSTCSARSAHTLTIRVEEYLPHIIACLARRFPHTIQLSAARLLAEICFIDSRWQATLPSDAPFHHLGRTPTFLRDQAVECSALLIDLLFDQLPVTFSSQALFTRTLKPKTNAAPQYGVLPAKDNVPSAIATLDILLKLVTTYPDMSETVSYALRLCDTIIMHIVRLASCFESSIDDVCLQSVVLGAKCMELLSTLLTNVPERQTACLSQPLWQALCECATIQLDEDSDWLRVPLVWRRLQKAALSCLVVLTRDVRSLRLLKEYNQCGSVVDDIVEVFRSSCHAVDLLSSRVTAGCANTLYDALTYQAFFASALSHLRLTLSLFCNLLLEFSPLKSRLIVHCKTLPQIVAMVRHFDVEVRTDAAWALMNLSYSAPIALKLALLKYFASETLLHSVMNFCVASPNCDASVRWTPLLHLLTALRNVLHFPVNEATNTLRQNSRFAALQRVQSDNILDVRAMVSPDNDSMELDVESCLSECDDAPGEEVSLADYAVDLLQYFILLLESDVTNEVKAHTIYVVANMAHCGRRGNALIMRNDDLLKKLLTYLLHPDRDLQIAALQCVANLLSDPVNVFPDLAEENMCGEANSNDERPGGAADLVCLNLDILRHHGGEESLQRLLSVTKEEFVYSAASDILKKFS